MNSVGRPKISDVAKRCGVSIATVSLALNRDGRVATDTMNMVLSVARDMGYVRNIAASQLKQGRTKTFGIAIFPGFNECHFELAFQVRDEALRHGYATRFFFTDLTRPLELEKFFSEITGQIDGLISYSGRREISQYARLQQLGIPCVFNSELEFPVDYVTTDFFTGGRLATEYLLNKGYRRIASFYHPTELADSLRGRFRGYRDAMTEAGLDYRPLSVEFTGSAFFYQDLYDLSRRILATAPDAVFVRSDFAALTLLRAICDAGMRPGADVAVVGFDNIQMGVFSNPSLTTVDGDAAWQAREMVRILLARLNGDDSPPFRSYSQCRLIQRESA